MQFTTRSLASRHFSSLRSHSSVAISCVLLSCATAQTPTTSSSGNDTTTCSSDETSESTTGISTAENSMAEASAAETSSSSSSSETTDATASSSHESPASTTEASSSTTETSDASTGSVILCGNGLIDGDEACDDGNQADFDGCSKTCTDEFLMFVTTAAFSPNFGDVAGADTLCQSAADGANLTGTYVAWVSVWDDNAWTDLPKGEPLIRRDGATIVAKAEDLIKGQSTILQNPINLDQNGNPATGYAWTGTHAQGLWQGWDCNNWTVHTTGSIGAIGNLNSTHQEWSLDNSPDPIEEIYCDSTHHFYCFRAQSG